MATASEAHATGMYMLIIRKRYSIWCMIMKKAHTSEAEWVHQSFTLDIHSHQFKEQRRRSQNVLCVAAAWVLLTGRNSWCSWAICLVHHLVVQNIKGVRFKPSEWIKLHSLTVRRHLCHENTKLTTRLHRIMSNSRITQTEPYNSHEYWSHQRIISQLRGNNPNLNQGNSIIDNQEIRLQSNSDL